MECRVVDKKAVKRAAARSTKASAKLESRTVPTDYVRTGRVERFVAERRQQH